MIKRTITGILLSLALLSVSACGSSDAGNNGGSVAGATTPSTTPTTYTKATVKISFSGDLGGKGVIGAGFTITLPDNVTPETANNVVATSVVTPSGTFAGSTITPIVTYSAKTATTPGTIKVLLTSSQVAGVTTAGEVATIMLQLANGATPTAAQFSLSSVPVSIFDTGGNVISGVTASVSGVTLQ